MQNLLDYLLANDLALIANPVARLRNRITWHSMSRAETDFFQPEQNVDAYRAWAEGGHYSAMLFDGALLQISFDISGNQLVGHRLAYVPCPFSIDREMLETDPVGDLLDLFSGDTDGIVLRSLIRFDFDPERAAPGHPASHFTFNSSDCRIPCVAPLRLGHFIAFVFRHFYPEIWKSHKYLQDLARDSWRTEKATGLTEVEAGDVHISWKPPK